MMRSEEVEIEAGQLVDDIVEEGGWEAGNGAVRHAAGEVAPSLHQPSGTAANYSPRNGIHISRCG